jgi:hypothetical protein
MVRVRGAPPAAGSPPPSTMPMEYCVAVSPAASAAPTALPSTRVLLLPGANCRRRGARGEPPLSAVNPTAPTGRKGGSASTATSPAATTDAPRGMVSRRVRVSSAARRTGARLSTATPPNARGAARGKVRDTMGPVAAKVPPPSLLVLLVLLLGLLAKSAAEAGPAAEATTTRVPLGIASSALRTTPPKSPPQGAPCSTQSCLSATVADATSMGKPSATSSQGP